MMAISKFNITTVVSTQQSMKRPIPSQRKQVGKSWRRRARK